MLISVPKQCFPQFCLNQEVTYFYQVIEPGPLTGSVTGIQTTVPVDPLLADPTESAIISIIICVIFNQGCHHVFLNVI